MRFIKTDDPFRRSAREFLRYLGPGILITVGFIDPGNWASNMAAGADYGYLLLWMVTLSTIMLINLQHNAAHVGIVTGDCMSEAAVRHLPHPFAILLIVSAMFAAGATALAELLGGALALSMLFGMPILPGAFLTALLCGFLLWSNSYKRLERIIIGFVSLIGISFLIEIGMVDVDWGKAVAGWVTPSFPTGSLPVIASVLGAVVMPHNLFLHSEIIQSREWNLEDEAGIRRHLRYEFFDTLFSMGIGWAINSAMILIAAVVFFSNGLPVTDLAQAVDMLRPLLGPAAAAIFAIALLLSGFASTMTAGMAGGTIFSALFNESYDIDDNHTRAGVGLTYVLALIFLCFVTDPFQGLLYSQMALSMQLPFTIWLLFYLTSSRKVMGKYVNNTMRKGMLAVIGIFVTVLNVMLLHEMLFG